MSIIIYHRSKQTSTIFYDTGITDGPIRFNELQRKMPEEMTHTTLSRQLKKLEEEGLIERIEYQQIPPKVEYKLSNIGEKFRKVLKELEIWGNEYIQYLNDKEC